NYIASQLSGDYNLVQAVDGDEGIDRAVELMPEVIVSDVMMPGKDGYQLCREIKSNPRTRHIPVILLTAKAGMEEKITALDLGVDDYLAKPFNSQELQAKVRSLIQLRKLEREVQARSEELEKAFGDLQDTQSQLVHSEQMASLGLLVAGIAHEVNNPVSFAKGSISNLQRYLDRLKRNEEAGDQPEKSKKLLRDMEKSIEIIKMGLERTEGIVTDLKAFARKDEKNFKRVNIEEGLKATLKLLQSELGTRIALHETYGIASEIEVVPGQINQVFMNLLQNAIHAIERKGTIWVETSEGPDQVSVSVRDDGTGINPEHMDRIFEPFFTTKPVGKGTGLGLSVSYRIIKNHQGDLGVTSTPDRGTEFLLTLPKRQASLNDGNSGRTEQVAAKGVRP
ncbi:MAG TPA: ATP-binding protein, partial [Nitrospiria bacterium]|nr:ATP-binding protein [Nitrospiria bacterium]